MRSRRRVVALGFIAFVAFAFWTAFLMAPKQQPFDSRRWKAAPATGRWVNENLRFRMSEGAAKAVQQGASSTAIEALLGSPDGSADYAAVAPPYAKSSSYIYELGYRRHPILFWEARARVSLEVLFDPNGRCEKAQVVEEKLDP